MDIVEWIMLVFLLLPISLLFASMYIELVLDIVKDIIETFKGGN